LNGKLRRIINSLLISQKNIFIAKTVPKKMLKRKKSKRRQMKR